MGPPPKVELPKIYPSLGVRYKNRRLRSGGQTQPMQIRSAHNNLGYGWRPTCTRRRVSGCSAFRSCPLTRGSRQLTSP